MTPKIGRLSLAVVQALGAGLAVTLAVPAQAQVQAERIEVTGSHIKRIESETALPVTVITRGDIERMRAVTTQYLLKSTTPPTPILSNTTTPSAYPHSTLNLRL